MAASPRSSLTGADVAALMALAPSMATDDDAQFLPWKIAFRVQFQSEKFGLRFHPAQFPDTGNGVYTIRLLELTKGPDGSGPAQHYNASLQAGQEHLVLRPGLYLTHINDLHLVDEPCESVIQSLQSVPRPVTLRFVDVEAGVVTRHELRDSLALDPESLAAISRNPGASGAPSPAYVNGGPVSPSKRREAAPVSPIYKIILLGTTGVGKSSILAVGVSGDSAYVERRPTTLEPEFGSIEISDPDISNPNKLRARIWDTAGQERYRAITRSHYRRADGALLVYDVADPDSFEKLGEWLKTLQETAEDSLKCIMVVENKADQLPELLTSSGGPAQHRPPRPSSFVQGERVRAFCDEHGLLFARTSAKMNACAFKWEAQRVSDAVSHLLLSIHAATLARGSDQQGLGAAKGAGAPSLGNADGRVVLVDLRGGAGGGSAPSDNCGACGKN
ncbi:hypothetical protein PybrP1_000138 [[Pythium] brassicae (nom. inval.)]|nr:hypothetical protein PybrP1_000138 [[Pythium] brassicae (nom. inval.)]